MTSTSPRDCIERTPGERARAPRCSRDQVVRVTFVRPPGRSTSIPRASATRWARSCAGTTAGSGVSHGATRAPGRQQHGRGVQVRDDGRPDRHDRGPAPRHLAGQVQHAGRGGFVRRHGEHRDVRTHRRDRTVQEVRGRVRRHQRPRQLGQLEGRLEGRPQVEAAADHDAAHRCGEHLGSRVDASGPADRGSDGLGYLRQLGQPHGVVGRVTQGQAQHRDREHRRRVGLGRRHRPLRAGTQVQHVRRRPRQR